MKGKKRRTDADGQLIEQTLGKAAVEAYVSALISLWKKQHALGTNPLQPERDAALKAMLNTRRRQEHERKRNEYVDRGIGTLLDGYSDDEFVRCIQACWRPPIGPSTGSKRKRTDPEAQQKARTSLTVPQWSAYLRTAVDLLASRNMLLRGELVRSAELPDLFCVPLKNQGATECQVLCWIISQGKTNSFGRLEYGVCVRNREIEKCLLSHLAFYFFFRWQCEREPPPRFTRRALWYRTKVAKGLSDAQRPLHYQTQLDWTNRIFDSCGVVSYKKTHSGRKQGAQHAELLGISEQQIQRAGRWNTDSMSNAYLTHIPREFVRGTAGFAPYGTGDYYIPRANVEVPESLVRKLWPWVDTNLAWFEQQEEELNDDADTVRHTEADDRFDLAGKSFLHLLRYLRTVLIQDSVILRTSYPDHPLFQHPFFEDAEYAAFVRVMEHTLEATAPQPQDVLVQQALPVLADRMTSGFASVEQRLERGFLDLRTMQGQHFTYIQDIFSGRSAITITTTPMQGDAFVRGAAAAPSSVRSVLVSQPNAPPSSAPAPSSDDPRTNPDSASYVITFLVLMQLLTSSVDLRSNLSYEG